MRAGDSILLFDSGAGTMRRLLEAGVEIYDVSFIFYSHFHPDHTSELVPFLFSNKYPDGSRRKIPLTLAAGKGFIKFYENLKLVYGHWIELDTNLLNIIELDNTNHDIRRFDNFKVESIPVEHNPESIAYRITGSDGISVVYSGDTDFSDNLVLLSKNADVLICESALPDNLKVKGHLTPSLAGEIAKRANVRKLVLTHFYPECDQVDVEKECRKTYPGPLVLAEDLMTIDI
jgi:ribonuclease BN (tRNA processing enzyme)